MKNITPVTHSQLNDNDNGDRYANDTQTSCMTEPDDRSTDTITIFVYR